MGKNGKKRSETPQKESASEASWAVDWAGGKGSGTLSPPHTTARFTSLVDYFFSLFSPTAESGPRLLSWDNTPERRSRFVTLPWKQNFWITTTRKRHLKNEFALFQTSSILFNFIQFVKCWRNYPGVNPKGPYVSFKKNCLYLTYAIKRAPEISKFHIAVVQLRLKNVQKSVMHVQSCCFAILNLLLFCRSRCRRRRRCFSSILLWSRYFATMVTWCHSTSLYWCFVFFDWQRQTVPKRWWTAMMTITSIVTLVDENLHSPEAPFDVGYAAD